MKSIEGLTHTFAHDVGKKYGVVVKGNSAILGWIVRHAASVLNRFMVKPSGRTALEELKLVRFDSPVLAFGENVLARRSGVPDNRLSSTWALDLAWQSGRDQRAHRRHSGRSDQSEDGEEATGGVAMGERAA